MISRRPGGNAAEPQFLPQPARRGGGEGPKPRRTGIQIETEFRSLCRRYDTVKSLYFQAFVPFYLRGKKLYGEESWAELVDAMETAVR